MMSKTLRAGVVAAIALVVAGCGGGYTPKKGVVVKGTVLKAGQPLQVPRRDIGLGGVEVQLVPTGPAADSRGVEVALAAENGSFELRGAGSGIPPGKYKLAVLQHDKGPGSDILKGAFSPAKTPITVEVPEDKLGGTHDLGVIDLDKPGK
jgi:hypothetical protein